MSDEDFAGHEPRMCGEHRSVGYRAWCFDCSEWCYPDGPCARCELARLRAIKVTVHERGCLGNHYGNCEVSGLFTAADDDQ